MFNFKTKAEEIVAVGEANRGMVKPEGAPKRVYDYWLNFSDSRKAKDIRLGDRRENFCHFWRVVAIWAPLLWLGRGIVRVVEAKYTGVVFGVFGVLGVIAVLYIVFGEHGWMGLLGIGLLAVGLLALMGILILIVNYLENHPKVAKATGWTIAGLLGLGVLALYLYAAGLIGLGILVVGAVIGLLIRANIERLSDWVEARRAKALEAERERARKRRAYYNAYVAKHGYYPHEKAQKDPDKVTLFFRGVGDFIIMAANVVRVNKWKICPLIELDEPR